MKSRRAKCLIYLGSKRRSTGFRHFYQLDGRQLSFFTSVEQLGLSDHSLRIAAAQAALANLMDLCSITLPQEVVIEGIELNRGALQFWENTARNLAAERLVEDNLSAHVLDTRWRSRSSLRGRIEPLSESVRRKRLLAMSGGKESLAALKIMRKPSECSLFFLHYPDSGWHHGRRLMRFFQRTHDCVKVRTDITGTGQLTRKYNCSAYGMFVIGQIAFSALLLMDRFSSISIGNEFSANFGNGFHDGIAVNHQYDKSFIFAQELNGYLAEHVTDDFTHTSPFWQWHEYRIASKFFADDRFLKQWTSCNNSTATNLFCGACAKCAFVFVMGAAHTEPSKIRRLMGANMLNELELIRSLADPDARKPLECVGTKEEVWVALEDIWQKQIWRGTPALKYFAQSIRPSIISRIPSMRKHLMEVQSLRAFARLPGGCLNGGSNPQGPEA